MSVFLFGFYAGLGFFAAKSLVNIVKWAIDIAWIWHKIPKNEEGKP